jgi:hypothetical protein
MSAAIQAKSARARTNIAIRMLRNYKSLGRSFDDCFEMGDGDDVVRFIVDRAKIDPVLHEILVRRGFGYWLEADYLLRTTGRP